MNCGTNKMTLNFQLPEIVDREKLIHFSYCFEISDENPLQYSVAYFEFDTKSERQDIKSTKKVAPSMTFQGGSSNGGNNPSTRNGPSNNSSSAASGQHSQSSVSNSTNSRRTTTFASSTKFNSRRHHQHHDQSMTDSSSEDDEEQPITTYSQQDFERLSQMLRDEMHKREHALSKKMIEKEDKLRQEMMERERELKEMLSKERKEYKEKLKSTLTGIREQKEKMKDRYEMQDKELNAKNAIIEQQKAEMAHKNDEVEHAYEHFNHELNKVREKLRQSEQARDDMKNALVLASTAPRVIHSHPDYQSVVDNNKGALTPSKRPRIQENHEKEGNLMTVEIQPSVSEDNSFESVLLEEEKEGPTSPILVSNEVH